MQVKCGLAAAESADEVRVGAESADSADSADSAGEERAGAESAGSAGTAGAVPAGSGARRERPGRGSRTGTPEGSEDGARHAALRPSPPSGGRQPLGKLLS